MKLEGFFFKREKKEEGQKKDVTISTSKGVYGCEGCKLYEGCITPKMSFTGEGKKSVLIVAEAPGKTEDEQGIQLVGRAGQFFRKELQKLDLDLDIDFWKMNALSCRPPKNRKPTKRELKCCRPRVIRAIKELKPKFIWLLGGSAIESFYIGRFSNLSISRWRGYCIPDTEIETWVVPMYHPSYLIRNETDKNLFSIYSRDLKKAVSYIHNYKSIVDDELSNIVVVVGFKEVCDLLSKVKKEKLISFDYETSGIKSYNEGHKIYSIAVSTGKYTYSFPFQHPEAKYTNEEFNFIRDEWINILKDGQINKVAHNLKFEEEWTRSILGVEGRGWQWDTMVAQHILDSRQGVIGLKFQVYKRWGIYPYDVDVEKYIKGDESGFNTLDKASLDKLLIYNARDALFTYKLYNEQIEEFSGRNRGKANSLSTIYKLFHYGVLAFCDIQEEGIYVDDDYYQNIDVDLGTKIENGFNELNLGIEARKFRRDIGHDINWNSTKDLRILVYKILKVPYGKTTDKGSYSVDAETLLSIDDPSIKKFLELKKLIKIKNTYLHQFIKYSYKGKLHPTFNLHIARTGRSSSDSPNFQNIPYRDKETRKIVRSGVVPTKGNKLLEVDYSSIEVRIAACYTKDPVLISYINDPTTDMHKDIAKQLFFLNDDEITKELRFYAKNGFVFPQFYGSYYKPCAWNLWENIHNLDTKNGVNTRYHLSKWGIPDYDTFESHVRTIEDEFWGKFSVFRKWQNKIVDFYISRGYTDTFFGFRRGGYLRRNEIINSPIQGTAFHVLLWSLIRLNELRKKEKWRTKIIGQIHDSILFDLCPDEEDYIISICKRIMCSDIREENKWIIVPLDVEFEITGIDESWYNKKNIN